MIVQVSEKKIIPGALSVWHSPGPEVDIVMDLKAPGFATGSIQRLYVFHFLERLLPAQVEPAISVWKRTLAPNAKMFIVNDDFEFLARSVLGADLNIGQFNAEFSHPTYFTRDNLTDHLKACGFPLEAIALWFADVTNEFKRQPYELVVSVDNI